MTRDDVGLQREIAGALDPDAHVLRPVRWVDPITGTSRTSVIVGVGGARPPHRSVDVLVDDPSLQGQAECLTTTVTVPVSDLRHAGERPVLERFVRAWVEQRQDPTMTRRARLTSLAFAVPLEVALQRLTAEYRAAYEAWACLCLAPCVDEPAVPRRDRRL